MPTSTRFVVSVHTLVLLARQDGSPVRSEEIAADVGTNPAVIRSLLSRLASVGLTTSQRGKGGGALLARPASEIRLLDAYTAVEEREIFAFPAAGAGKADSVGRDVFDSLAAPLGHARDALEQELANITVQDIVDDIARKAA